MRMKRVLQVASFAIAMTIVGGVLAEEVELTPANTRVDNLAALQRGARLFFNYCAGCHSLQYLRYSRLAEDLQLSEDQVLTNFAFTGAKIGELVVSNMPQAKAEEWFGKAPPDLSLEARAKGPDWIYNYLKGFYLDDSRPIGWNNTVFANASMPNPLWELQGVQRAVYAPAKPGEEPRVERLEIVTKGTLTPEEFDQVARDLTTFLEYVGEPARLRREAMGVWVLLYLGFFTLLAWLLKREYWKDVH